jgi:hypothetical protein
MGKTHRVSVPLTPDLERQVRRLSAENGRSVATNLAELARAGAQTNAIERELLSLRSMLQSAKPRSGIDAESLAQLRAEMLEIVSKHAFQKASFEAQKNLAGGLFLPEKAARLLFGEALFSSALSAQILNAEMPGTPPKPAGFHIRAAREKANLQFAELLTLERT